MLKKKLGDFFKLRTRKMKTGMMMMMMMVTTTLATVAGWMVEYPWRWLKEAERGERRY